MRDSIAVAFSAGHEESEEPAPAEARTGFSTGGPLRGVPPAQTVHAPGRDAP